MTGAAPLVLAVLMASTAPSEPPPPLAATPSETETVEVPEPPIGLATGIGALCGLAGAAAGISIPLGGALALAAWNVSRSGSICGATCEWELIFAPLAVIVLSLLSGAVGTASGALAGFGAVMVVAAE